MVRANVISLLSSLLLLAVAVSAGFAGGAAPAPLRVRLAAVADAATAAGLPGVVVYTRIGSQATTVTSGVADVTTHRVMTREDRFRIGSVTKTFTATVIMQLVHEEKLALTDTVEQHLPGLVPNGGSITYRQLLSHTSGLADYFSNTRIFAPYAAGHLTYVWPHTTIVRISAKDKPIFAPGAPGKVAYSNTGYYILGLTIEKLTGRTLASELERRIFRPLRLRHTTLPSTNRPSGRYAHGYTDDFGKKHQDVSILSPSILWAAGGIISTPAEIAAFYRALFQGRLLPLALVRQMQTREVDVPQSRGRQSIGLGLFRAQLPCTASWGYNGDLPGYTTQSFSSADGRRQAVIAINAGEEGAFT
ncbi:MAG TPA: serine hydrolase domain-containing protein, partial [Microbacteriaceae bacterium]|nr:serine hydrolase domain-containing protein [Microbacteriaceae bacterium]